MFLTHRSNTTPSSHTLPLHVLKPVLSISPSDGGSTTGPTGVSPRDSSKLHLPGPTPLIRSHSHPHHHLPSSYSYPLQSLSPIEPSTNDKLVRTTLPPIYAALRLPKHHTHPQTMLSPKRYPSIHSPSINLNLDPGDSTSSLRESMPDNTPGGSRGSSVSSDGLGGGAAPARGNARSGRSTQDGAVSHQTRNTRTRKGKAG